MARGEVVYEVERTEQVSQVGVGYIILIYIQSCMILISM